MSPSPSYTECREPTAVPLNLDAVESSVFALHALPTGFAGAREMEARNPVPVVTPLVSGR